MSSTRTRTRTRTRGKTQAFKGADYISIKELKATYDAAQKASEPWLKFEVDSKKERNDDCKKYDVHFLPLLVRNIKGKYVRLNLKTTATKTAGKVGRYKPDEKIGDCQILTRIGALNPTDDDLEDLAKDYVSDTFDVDTLDDDEFFKQVDIRLEQLKKEALQWDMICKIDAEFKKIATDKKLFKDQLNWKNKAKKIKGCVQYTRELGDDEDPENVNLDPDDPDRVVMDEPIVRSTMKVNKKTGEIWCKILEIPTSENKSHRPIPATATDKKGKESPLTFFNVTDWLTYGSVVLMKLQFQATLSSQGITLKSNVKKLTARIAAMSKHTEEMDADDLGDMMSFGGKFGKMKIENNNNDKNNDSDSDSESESNLDSDDEADAQANNFNIDD